MPPNPSEASARETTRSTATAIPSQTHPVVGWLWSMCETSRPELAAPMTVMIGGEPWAVGTNGHILATTRGDFGFASPDPRLNVARMIETIPNGMPWSLDVPALRAIATPTLPPDTPDCLVCKNTGREVCEECEGDGQVECMCHCGDDHDKDCDVCDGDGWVVCDCGRSPGKDTDVRRVYIGAGMFNLNVIARALPHVVGNEGVWRQDKADGMARLDIGDWRLLIMPLRQLDNANPADVYPRVELSAVLVSV